MYLLNLILHHYTGTLWSCGSLSLYDLLIDCMFGGRILFTGNSLNGPIWYISVLLICYVIAFFISKKIKKYGSYLYICPIIIGLVIFYFNNIQPVIFKIDLARGLVAFFTGVLLGSFFEIYNAYSRRKK